MNWKRKNDKKIELNTMEKARGKGDTNNLENAIINI